MTQWLQLDDFGPYAMLWWTESVDDVGVVRYDVLRNGEVVKSFGPDDREFSGAQVFIEITERGPKWYQVQAVDAAGNVSRRSAPVVVWGELGPPTAPRDLSAVFDPVSHCLSVGFTNSPGDFQLTFYPVFQNGRGLDLLPGSEPDEGGLPNDNDRCVRPQPGTRFIQVAASSAGGTSVKSPPVRVEIPRVPIPAGFDAVIDGDTVTFTWDDPHPVLETIIITDALNVVGEFGPDESGVTIDLPPSKNGDGRHWFQIRGIGSGSATDTLRSRPLLVVE